MDIIKKKSESIVETKELVVIKDNVNKIELDEKNCDKMVANTQDNLGTASEVVEQQQQHQQLQSMLNVDTNIAEIKMENDLLKDGNSLPKLVNNDNDLPENEITEEIKTFVKETVVELGVDLVSIPPKENKDTNKESNLIQFENVEEIPDEDEDDDTELTSKNIPNSSDVDDDEEDDVDEEEDVDEDNESDGVMVLDSSDEEKERKAVNNLEQSYGDNDDDVEDSIDSDIDSDEYDDDDLMDDVIMSAKNNKLHNLPSTSKTIHGNKLSQLIKNRRKMKKSFAQFSYRCQAKKRSVKWLNSKMFMHNVEELHNQNIKIHNDDDNELMAIDDNDYQFSIESLTNSDTGISLAASNTSLNSIPMKLSQENIIELDSSPEKSINNQLTNETDNIKISKNQFEYSKILSTTDVIIEKNNKQLETESSVEHFEEIDEIKLTEKMQPIEKIRETIQKSEDINELTKKPIGIGLIDEQNKENVGNNDKVQINVEETTNKSVNKIENICNGEKIDNDVKTTTDNNVDKKIYPKILNNDIVDVIVSIDVDEQLNINNKSDIKSNIEKNLEEPKNSNLQDTQENKPDDSLNTNISKDDKVIASETPQKNIIVPADNKEINTQKTRKRSRSSYIEDFQSIDASTPVNSSDLFKQKQQLTENIENLHPTKKLRAELETNFQTHDRILSEYIERTSNDSPNDIEKHISQLAIEIQTLNDMIKAKEIEWNNMLHLKKVKEEICFRLTRKKQVMELMAIKVGEIPNSQQQQQLNQIDNCTVDGLTLTNNNNTIKSDIISGNQNNMLKIPNINTTSAALAAMAAAASSSIYNLSGNNTTGGTTAQTILQNRANMKSSDLAKEKANTQKLHRLLVSRNILPKPGSSSSSSFAVTSSTITTSTPTTSIVNAHQLGLLGTTSAPIVLTSSQNNNNLPQQLQQFPLSLSNIASGSLLSHINNSNNSNGLLHQQQPILNSYLTAAASVQQQLGELFNGHHQSQLQQQNAQNLMIGRQGVFKDVKSIIADYRQRHPEQVPRRGRRMKSTNSNDISSGGQRGNNNDLSSLLNRFEGNSRPSSNDSSSHSITNVMSSNLNSNNSTANVSFKDALLQIAKISGQNADRISAAVAASSLGKTSNSMQTTSVTSPYPEVTLHPVSTSNVKNDSTGSLLHGILTKYTRQNPSSPTAVNAGSACNNTASSSSLLVHQLNQQQTTCTPTSTTNNYNSTFSPTLARLLTAPERMANSGNQNNINNQGSHATITARGSSPVTNTFTNISSGSSGGLNLSKVVAHNSEITITPVVNSALNIHQSILQQQIHKQHQQQIKDVLTRNIGLSGDKIKGENIMNMDDEADDSVDRLVIDEGGDSSIGADEQYRIAPRAIGQEFNENEVPACQGCKKQEAQFVCAGCGNQWYCSRECQVQAWDEHSEVCTG